MHEWIDERIMHYLVFSYGYLDLLERQRTMRGVVRKRASYVFLALNEWKGSLSMDVDARTCIRRLWPDEGVAFYTWGIRIGWRMGSR
ncbi:hypothetical protein EYC84_003491 [Monilinia fructicola]|uniref:Uncharacterized protein n=1 Tax=Monilinia fructicola TaxID=38448 RepID=A0A5M9JUQ0_MONFR|nr:hypothetical protein EYC84_003491 [Monilinia fructicola]